MVKHFNEQKWLKAIKYPDWYLKLADEYRKLMKKCDESNREISEEIKEEIYQFF